MPWLIKSKKGFTLIETIIGLGVFVIISGSLIMLFQQGLRVTSEDKARNGALALAQEKIETIKNLAYIEIGTQGGIPAGNIAQSETVTLNNIDYDIITDIRYIDDIFDGTVTTGDALEIDYKKVQIQVSWVSKYNTRPIVLVTNIAPRDLEQEELGETGTLWIEVYDNSASPVPTANVAITNNLVTPNVSITSQTGTDGIYLLPGAPLSIQGYEVTVTKNSFSTDKTYDSDLLLNPNPTPAHLSVGMDEVTSQSFFIDYLSNLNIAVKDYGTDDAIADFPFTLAGEKTIGSLGDGSPVYKYSQSLTSNATSSINLSNIEYDTYGVSFDNTATGYDLAGSSQFLPLVLSPQTTEDLTIHLTAHASNTLLVNIKDSADAPISEANVRLYKTDLSYDSTQATTAYGQTFFTPLDAETYNTQITKDGYATNTLLIEINGQTQETSQLDTL